MAGVILSTPRQATSPGGLQSWAGVLRAVLLVAGTAAAAALYSVVNSGSRPLDVVGMVLIVLIAGPIAARRWPLIALAVSVAALIPYHLLDYPPEVVLPAVMVLLYTVAVTGTRTRTVLTAVVVTVVVLVSMRSSAGGWSGGDAVDAVGWLVAALAFGEAIRSGRAYTAAVEERAVRAEHTREEEARRRVAEERLRIARDLHDLLAHNIAVIGMQSSVAAHLVDERDDDPPLAELSAPLHHVAATSAATLSEVRAMLGVLRGFGPENEERDPVPSLDRIADLITTARAAGAKVDLHEIGIRRALPAPVDITAYRIIQEALTNVATHAAGAKASVVVDYQPAELRLCVTDDGSGPAVPDGGSGFGLMGMTERALAIGGTLSAGPRVNGGFAVQAVLPAAAAPPETGTEARAPG